MPPARSRWDTAAAALAVVGLLVTAPFALGIVTPGPAYVAHEIDPGSDAELITRSSNDVFDLGDDVGESQPDLRDVLRTAAETGRYNGSDHPQVLHFMIHESDHRYVRFEGAFYRWNATAGSQEGDVDIRMAPANASTVVRDVAIPRGDVDPRIGQAIDGGDAVRTVSLGNALVEQSGNYYAVVPRDDGWYGPLAFVLQAVGIAYLAVGVGVLGLGRLGRRLTGRTALLIVVGAAAIAAVASTISAGDAGLVETVIDPVFAVIVALGLFAGVSVVRRSYRPPVVLYAAAAALVVGGAWSLLGSPALSDALFALVGAVLAGLPLAAVGVDYARESR